MTKQVLLLRENKHTTPRCSIITPANTRRQVQKSDKYFCAEDLWKNRNIRIQSVGDVVEKKDQALELR